MRRPLLLAGLLILALLLSACAGPAEPAVTGGPASPSASAAPGPADGTAAPEPTPSEDPIPSATPAVIPEISPSPTPDWTQGEEGELVVRINGEEQHIPAYGREYLLREEPHLGFSMMAPKESASAMFLTNAWYFPILTGSETPSWLEMSFIYGTDADDLLPDFINAYLDFTEIEFSGASRLGRIAMDETITASGTDLLVKAWLLNVPEGVFTVVLSCPLDRLDADLGLLGAMLDTLSLTM